MSKSAQRSHPTNLDLNSPRGQIADALARLAPLATSIELIALFNGRATSGQIRSWRLGRNGAPQWAVDCVAQALADKATADLDRARTLSAGPANSGECGTIALHNYRRQRALEREKAPS